MKQKAPQLSIAATVIMLFANSFALPAPGQPIPTNSSGTGGTLQIVSATGSFSPISAANKVLNVSPGATLNGTINLEAFAEGCDVCVVPLIYTPSWGNDSTSWQLINGWIPNSGYSSQTASVSLTAPASPGLYYIIFAFEWEMGGDNVASASNWGLGYDVWNDGNDIAEFDAAQIFSAQLNGYALDNWLFEGPNGTAVYEQQYVPSDAITLIVGGTAQVSAALSSLTAVKSAPSGGGRSAITATVILRDINSNAVPGKMVMFSADEIETFGSAQSFVPIPIVQPNNATDGNGTTTVTFAPTAAGVVVISAKDATDNTTLQQVALVQFTPQTLAPTKPALTIASPVSGTRWSNEVFAAWGTAKSSGTVASVWYSLNGNARALATGTTNWAAGMTLVTPGTNTFSAYAVDASGNHSPTNKVSFQYIPCATLIVQPNGHGTVSPNDNGKLLAIGTNYSLTASPGKNWIFSNWVASGSENFVSNNPVLNFTMQPNLVLQANFVPSVFLAAQGTYNGLFAPANAPRQQTNSGAITLTVTSGGVLSGKLTIGTNTPSLSGQFNPAGAATVTTPRKGQSSLITTLQLDFAGQTVGGSVTDGSFVAEVIADLDVFSAKHKAANYEGQYTFIIAGTDNRTVGPLGSSCGTVTVSPLGVVSFTASLADGTTAPANPSSVVSKDGYWPFYLPLYSGNGSLWSWNCFTNGAIMCATNASWINATNSTKGALYRAGFTNEAAWIFGSAYNPTNKPLLALSKGEVILAGGNLPFKITNQITLASNNAITVPITAENTNKLVLTINKTTGVISGTFAHPSNPRQTINVNGVLLQNETNAQGYFPGTDQSGAFILVPQ